MKDLQEDMESNEEILFVFWFCVIFLLDQEVGFLCVGV
jgi:hypothetical protein